jgi:Leucine-rich repeat (LRR) protein
LSDISPLAGLTHLTHLSLKNNSVSDISALAGLTDLYWLELNDNNISDISPLVGSSGLASGVDGSLIDIRYNPIDCDDTATLGCITTLEDRGYSLFHDCQ